MSAPARSDTGLYAPPGFPLREYLVKLNNQALGASSAYRRAITKSDPLMFGLVYMARKLRSPDGLLSFSEMHVELAELAKSWMLSDLRMREIRRAVVAPRDSGKSTWAFGILPMWALAHGHRDFIVAFSDVGPSQAEQHLENMRIQFETNRLLQLDFPELCLAERATQRSYRARSGATMKAFGAKTATLGMNDDGRRPNLLLLDDIEPKAEDYSPKLKEKRLKTLREAIFPMNDRAVVLMTGTVVMKGSIADDVMTGAEWVSEENIKLSYFPAIVDNGDGSERSLWPEKWPLEDMLPVRHTAGFKLNMMNQPANPDGAFWKESDFSYDVPRDLTARVLAIDPAVTTSERSDFTGMAVVAYSPTARRAVVEMSSGTKLTNQELRARVHQLCTANPSISHVLIETNQGGDVWETILQPLPRGVKLEPLRSGPSKANRFKLVHDYYERGWVAHLKPFPELEGQACSFPHTQFDDVLDAACLGVHWWLKDRPRPLIGVG